jgi:hypothetical protein
MNLVDIVRAASLTLVLAGAVGSAKADQFQPLSPEQLSTLKISAISADADQGVVMTDGDFNLVCQQVTNYVEENHPGMMTAADAQALKMRIHFMHFEHGNQLKRWLLPGAGRTSMEATVFLEDASGKQVASYDVSVHFSRPGVPGATTTTSDVEDFFAKAVGRTVTDKP